MQQEWERRKVCTRFMVGKMPYRRPRRRQNDIKMDLSRSGMGAETRLIWLRIQTGGGLL